MPVAMQFANSTANPVDQLPGYKASMPRRRNDSRDACSTSREKKRKKSHTHPDNSFNFRIREFQLSHIRCKEFTQLALFALFQAIWPRENNVSK